MIQKSNIERAIFKTFSYDEHLQNIDSGSLHFTFWSEEEGWYSDFSLQQKEPYKIGVCGGLFQQCQPRLDGYGWKTSRHFYEHVMAKKLCLISSSMTRRCSQTVRDYCSKFLKVFDTIFQKNLTSGFWLLLVRKHKEILWFSSCLFVCTEGQFQVAISWWERYPLHWLNVR